jgi:hypothetical protein
MATGSAASAGQVTRLQIWPIAERLRTEYKVQVVLKIRLIYCLKLQDNTVVNKQLRNAKQLLLLSIISHDWRSLQGHGDLRQKEHRSRNVVHTLVHSNSTQPSMHFKNTSSAETPQSGGSTMPNQRDPPWHYRTITLRGRVLFDFTEQRDMVVLSSDSLIFMAGKDRQAVLDIPSSKTLHFKYA